MIQPLTISNIAPLTPSPIKIKSRLIVRNLFIDGVKLLNPFLARKNSFANIKMKELHLFSNDGDLLKCFQLGFTTGSKGKDINSREKSPEIDRPERFKFDFSELVREHRSIHAAYTRLNMQSIQFNPACRWVCG